MSTPGTVGEDDRIRLFLALELPGEVEAELARWAASELTGGRRLSAFHVTLAFLGGQPRGVVAPTLGVLRDEAGSTEPFELEPLRYRETSSVGMLVLADRSGAATSLATRLQSRLEELGVYVPERRQWLPHVTVIRFRVPPRLAPAPPLLGAFAPSGAAAFLSRLHPSGARYEVLESCPLDA